MSHLPRTLQASFRVLVYGIVTTLTLAVIIGITVVMQSNKNRNPDTSNCERQVYYSPHELAWSIYECPDDSMVYVFHNPGDKRDWLDEIEYENYSYRTHGVGEERVILQEGSYWVRVQGPSYAIFANGLADILQIRAEEVACFAAQRNAEGVLDPSNCIGFPKTPGKKCTSKDPCWAYCDKHRSNCGPEGVTHG